MSEDDSQFRPSNVLIETPRLVDSLGEWLDSVDQGFLPESPETKKAVKLASLIMALWPECPYISSAVERHDTLLKLRESVTAELASRAEKSVEAGTVVSLIRPKN